MAISQLLNSPKKPIVILMFGFLFFNLSGQNVVYKNDRAVAVKVPGQDQSIKIYREGKETPVLGKTDLWDSAWCFVPVIPFQPGASYKMVSNSGEWAFSILENQSPTPFIIGVYPSIDTLPENVLKIYIEFSEPMRAIDSYRFIKVFCEDDEVSPFLPLQPELWNHDNTIMTLWLDPGRIKQDLLRNQMLGKPLIKGHQYTLQIDGAWASQNGQPLGEPFQKKYFVGDPIRQSIDLSNWKVKLPKSGTKDPLYLIPNTPLDHQLAEEAFQTEVPGTFKVLNSDQVIQFLPENTWSSGTFLIEVLPILEDLCGNNLLRPFDKDLQDSIREVALQTSITIQIN
ncbi:MAG: hypothetical protein RIC35_17540 [Marinoscillum sp.]